MYIFLQGDNRSGLGRIWTHFLGDIIFRAVTLGHHPPMTGFHSRVFVVLSNAFNFKYPFLSGGRGWFMFTVLTVPFYLKTTDLFTPAFLSRLSLAVASIPWLWTKQQPHIWQIKGLKQQKPYYANLSLAGGGRVLRLVRLYLWGSVFKSCQFHSGCTPCKQCTLRETIYLKHAPSCSDIACSKPSRPSMSRRQIPISTSMS